MVEHFKKILEGWKGATVDFLPKLVLAIATLFLFFILGKIVKKISLNIYSRSGLASIHPDIAKAIIAGFAFKDIASNTFAGLLLKTRHPFKKGDWVRFNDEYGKVTDITLMTTSMKNIFGQQIFIPNQLIYNDTFANFSTYGKRRILIKSGVSYGDDLEHAKEAAIDEIKKSSSFLPDDPIDFYYTEIGDSTFNFELLFWIRFDNESDFYQARSAAIMNIKKRFEKENISIAYPVTTLDFGVKGGVNLFDKDVHIQSKNS